MKTHKVWWLWNKRWFGHKFHFLHGSRSWELQISTIVINLHYRGIQSSNPRLHVWRDSYGYRKVA